MKTTEYDKQAASFLTRNGIRLSIEPGPFKAPAWADKGEEHGNHYACRLTRLGKASVGFSFWGSINDRNAGRDPSAYDVLACISSDAYCPDTFAEFCSEYGYDTDSRKAPATWKRCRAFADKLQAFLTAKEIEELAEIR